MNQLCGFSHSQKNSWVRGRTEGIDPSTEDFKEWRQLMEHCIDSQQPTISDQV